MIVISLSYHIVDIRVVSYYYCFFCVVQIAVLSPLSPLCCCYNCPITVAPSVLLIQLPYHCCSLYFQAPADHQGTLTVSQRLTFIQPTLFGPSWGFTSDLAFGDTAFTSVGLGAHTDNTYFTAPSG